MGRDDVLFIEKMAHFTLTHAWTIIKEITSLLLSSRFWGFALVIFAPSCLMLMMAKRHASWYQSKHRRRFIKNSQNFNEKR